MTEVDRAVAAIERVGFAIVERPEIDVRAEYDRAAAAAAPGDVARGRSCTRVSDFVNRGPAFDRFWLDPVLLAICARAFAAPWKLSTFHARTVAPGGGPQELHVDLARDGGPLALLGYVWMVDEFRADNGATRFVPRDRSDDDAVVATGRRGTLVVFDGAIRHGYGANRTREPRRSLQGAFVARAIAQGLDQRARLTPETAARLDARARYVLDA